MITTLVHDVDGCLKDWVAGFTHWMRRQGYEVLKPEGGFSWNMSELFPGVTSTMMRSLIERFNTSPDFERLDDVLGALDGVQELVTRFPDLEHVAITCAGSHPHTLIHRAAHIYDFGIERAHILPLRASKTDLFRQYARTGAIVIEDSLIYLNQAREAGCIPICIRYSYNRGWDGHAVDSWSEIPDLVGQILGIEKTHDEEFAA